MINKNIESILSIVDEIYSQKMNIRTASHIIDATDKIKKNYDKYTKLRNKLIIDNCNIDDKGRVVSIKEDCDADNFYREMNSLENSVTDIRIDKISTEDDKFFDNLSPKELECLKEFFYI